MKIGFAFIIFFASCSSTALCQAKIKGHYIGESVKEFRVVEGIDQKIAACKISDATTISAYHLSQLSDDQFKAFQKGLVAAGYGKLSRKQAEKLASSGQFNTRESRTVEQEIECKALSNGFENGPASSYVKDAPNSITFVFVDDKVAEISFRVPKYSFPETQIDLTKRLGIQPELSFPEMFNAYGAIWKDTRATWLDPSIHAELLESNNPANQNIWLTVESRAKYDARIKRLAMAPSPLD